MIAKCGKSLPMEISGLESLAESNNQRSSWASNLKLPGLSGKGAWP